MKKTWLLVLISTIAVIVLLAGCGKSPIPASSLPPAPITPASGPTTTSTTSTTSSTTPAYDWPDTLHFSATGSSGEAKMVSWTSVMQSDLKGPIIRVVNEPAYTNEYKDLAANKMVLGQIDKVTLKDSIEASPEYASSDGGPWAAGLVWVDSLAFTGFMVRGNSNIYKPEDIKPGTKIAIWNDAPGTLNPFRSLLAWANVNEKDIIWVNTGDYNACPRAVVEGRADIAMAAPVTPIVMEVSAAPGGIRYINQNPSENPEGAKRFLQLSPLYDFAPITVGPKSAIGTWGIVSYKYLGANMNSDPQVVYNIVKWLDNKYDLYKDRYESNGNMTLNDVVTALQTIYIPVHPGLVQYLKEKGIWNADYEKRNQTNIALQQLYINGYKDAMQKAAAQNIDIKPNNAKWIEFWENYKLANKIPTIRMHISLTQDAPVVLPGGYAPEASPTPTTTTSSTATANTTTATPATQDVPLEVQSISAAHPGDDVTVTVKTVPGAEVTVLFTMPNGTNSAYPQDKTKTAGADGTVTWTWNINSHVPAGEAIYTFTAKLNGKQSTVIVKKVI